VFVDAHAEQGGHQQGVTQAADGEKFGDALQDAQKCQKRKTHATVLDGKKAILDNRRGTGPIREPRPDYAEQETPRQGLQWNRVI
jgi:hypothetical protein